MSDGLPTGRQNPQPRGRKTIAHGFIRGLRIVLGTSPVRDERERPVYSTRSFAPAGLGGEFGGALTQR
jgi:hypothetical protein